MQPITEILNEIPFPVWLCWGSSFALAASPVVSMTGDISGLKTPLTILPKKGLVILLLSMGLIFYSANDSIGRRIKHDQEMAKWAKEMAVMKTSWKKAKEERALNLDPRLRSIEGIIGYLDQSIRMDHEPKELIPIILFLAKEIQSLQGGE